MKLDPMTIASEYLAVLMHGWLNEAIRLNEPEYEMDKLCDFSQLAPHLRERYLYVARKLIETFGGCK